MAVVLDLGGTTAAGAPPEHEDHVFDPAQLAALGEDTAADFWARLSGTCKPSLKEIFGEELVPRSRGCTVDEKQGIASLGCLVPSAPPELYTTGFGRLRATITDGTLTADLSVTDLRLYEEDQKTLKHRVLEGVQRRIRDGVEVIASVGLARPFRAANDTAARHWLQLNNLHLADDPLWRAD